MPATAPSLQPRYSWADFVALDEDDLRELVDGDLVEVEVPTGLHEWIVMYIGTMLGNWVLQHGGKLLGSGYKVRIPDQGLTEGAPDLAVEVVSPTSGRHDRVTKLGWYASIGVGEYWLVDPATRTIERLVLVQSDAGPRWQIEDVVAEEGVFAPASFPGVQVDLARLFELPE